MSGKLKLTLGALIIGIAAMVLTLGSTSAIADVIWCLEDNEVCSKCHKENKKGHFSKNDCDGCHGPGAKKEVHSLPLLLWNVDVVDEWQTQCLSCHEWNKKGHQEQKKECLKCHGPDEKKDVHNYAMVCADCHVVEDGNLIVDGPDAHVGTEEKCGACHDYEGCFIE